MPEITFVHRHPPGWFLGADAATPTETLLQQCATGVDVWILGTYLRLQRAGLPVRLSEHFVKGGLCVAHRDDVAGEGDLCNSFVVSTRADRERTFTCDLEIVQSPGARENPRCHYLPHWPQPGLIPRDPERGNRLERIGYFGPAKNLAACFRSPWFRNRLESLGLELIIREAPERWRDYSDIDAALAVRDGLPYFLASKPASKLFNAWIAGCVPIVGSEPAYAHHGVAGWDFLRATSPEAALDALQRLKQQPDLFSWYRHRAHVKAEEINERQVAAAWERFLKEHALPLFEQWRRESGPFKTAAIQTRARFRIIRRNLRGNLYTRGYDFEGRRLTRRLPVRRRTGLLLDRLITAIERRLLMED